MKRYKHKRKACLPHTHNTCTCTVNIHVDVKAHPQRSGSAPEGCRIFIPSLPTDTSPHCYKLYTHQKVVRNPFLGLSAPENKQQTAKRSSGQCRFENADHVISHWSGEGAEFGAVPSENVRVVQPLTLPDLLKILITWTIRVTKILIT